MEPLNPEKKQDVPVKLSFPPSFFEDEVRDGFFVPETMKRFWAGHLTVLAEIDRICEKHGIRWWAAFGTLLGTVRHKGFIPWDDDIDIVMFRPDLDRFLEVAKEELPDYIGIRDVQTQPEYDGLCVRVTSTFLDEGHLEHFHGSLYTANVDVFALDNVYEEPETERERMRRLGIVCSAGAYFQPGAFGEGGKAHTRAELEPEKAEVAVRHVEELTGTRLNRKRYLFGQLLQQVIKLFRACPDENSREVVLFMDNEWFWKKEREWFRDTVRLPFEHITMPVCVDYEKELTAEYGDWHVKIRGGGHGEVAFAEQEAYMREKTGKNMFRYTYLPDDLHTPRVASLREQALSIVKILGEAHGQSGQLLAAGDADSVRQLLASCQTLAIRLGELLERRISGESPVIRALEAYCEAVFYCHERPDADTLQKVTAAFSPVDTEVRQMLAHREIVFLPVRASWWQTMEPVYRAALEEENTEVYVICVPWQERGENGGETGIWHDERELFPAEIQLTSPEAYDIAARCPDAVVTQFPYGGLYRPVGVDSLYHASSLRNLTEQLIYVPCYDADTPADNDVTARNTLRYLIEQPSVVFADQVVVATEGMRQLYVGVMTEIAGEDTRPVWESRLRVADNLKYMKIFLQKP